ncbi:DUF3987 domain-containing protein [Microcoleus sp. FACHB-53]|nr:DUF3987 domain-containing protein [Microcoleus sp. FACHB-53]
MVHTPIKTTALTIDRNQATTQLRLLGYQPGENVYMRFFVPDTDPRYGTPAAARKTDKLNWEEVERYQNDGYGVYFVINGGGHKDSEVKVGRAVFCEWDDRPIENQIFAWQSLNLLEPTMQIGTRKSVHNYWRADLTKDQWIELQQDLLVYTQSDQKLKNPSRVLRLAGCWHLKPGYEPMPCDIIHHSEKVYTYDELRAAIPRRQQPEQPTIDYQPPISGDVPLYQFLTKDDRALIDQGAGQGSRNDSGAKLARNLLGTAERLKYLGIRFSDDPRHLFHDYCYRCTPSLSTSEADTIWKTAQKDNPTSSLSDDALENCAKAWLKNQEQKSGRGYSSGIGFGGGNRRGSSGGSGGDGGNGDNKIIQLPSIQELTESQVKILVDEIIEKGLSGGELNTVLNGISHRTPWRIEQLYKLYYQKLQDIERIELRDNNREQLESLLDASNASLDLHDFLHPNLAKPLKHIASRLSLKPEVYLTALLITASSLHNPKTRIWLCKEDDFDQPAGLYGGIIAPSSQKKSPVLKAIAVKPLKVLDAEERENYKRKLCNYHRKMQEWEELSKEEKKDTDPPVAPERAVHYFTKTNGEGLDYQVPRQPDQGLLYLADELVSIINSQNQYRQGRGSDRQDLLSYYDGSNHLTLRADGVKSEFDTILLSILGGIQPKVMQSLLQNCEDSDGSWARFIFVHQPAVAGTLHADGGRIDLTELLVDVYRKIRALPTVEYTLTPEAFKIFQSAYARYQQNRVNDPLLGMQAVWGKCEGRVGRLALNLHVINSLANGDVPTQEIGADTMRCAIALTNYYAMQVKALYTEFSDSDALAPHLAKVIEMSLKCRKSKTEGWLKASDVYLAITKKHRPNPETVREWFTELVVMGKGEVRGSGRSLQFRAFLPNDPPPKQQLDEFRQELDKSSNSQPLVKQEVQEKLDKLDNLDDFPKNSTNSMDVQAIEFVEATPDTGLEKESVLDSLSKLDEMAKRTMDVQTIGALVTANTGVEKDLILDELSNSSNFAHNTQLEQVTALDNPSNKSSNLDVLLMEEAISPASSAIAPSLAAPEPAAVTMAQEEAMVATRTAEGIAPSPAPAAPEPVAGAHAADHTDPAEAEYKQLITDTDLELKRLGWDEQQGRDYLTKVYGLRSRHLLSNEQLRHFLQYLEAQPD